MSSTVSKSSEKDDHELSRTEKDNSFSTGAGRKAVEVGKPDRQKPCASNGSESELPKQKDGEEEDTGKSEICQKSE
jgi:hypothetical protein